MDKEKQYIIENDKKIEVIDLDYEQYKEKKSPWKQARKLEQEKAYEFLSPEQLYKNIVTKIDDPRDRCLVAICYLCAARISELVRFKKIIYGKKQVLITKLGRKAKKRYVQDYKKKTTKLLEFGMLKKDILIKDITGMQTVIFRLRNLKNKKNKTKLIPLPLHRDINVKFWNLVKTYIQVLMPEEELFKFQRRNGERIINKLNINPHFLRKLRLTHLANIHNFSDQKLKFFAGWTDSRPAKEYIRVSLDAVVKSM